MPKSRFPALFVIISVAGLAIAAPARCEDNASSLNDKMQAALNDQINAELYSSYIYLSMAAYFESENLRGFAHWMRIQSSEETTHGLMFFDYINERGGRVSLTKIDAPKKDWKSALDAFQDAYRHEKHVSSRIDDLVQQTQDLKDNATDNFLQFFVKEQVEEEANADEIVQQLKRIGDNPSALFLLDRELAKRKPPQ